MIVPDVNVLVVAMSTDAPGHDEAWAWWESTQRGPERIGLAWSVALAYIRLMTSPRILPNPISPSEAIADVRAWQASPLVDMLTPGPEHLHVMERMLDSAGRGGEFTPDAHLAALAFENGGTVASHDSDFARFPLVAWTDPLTSGD
jgi:toxin-antitoxin system PIN domain toxin